MWMMLWLQVEQWKKKDWVSEALDRTYNWSFPKHWTSHVLRLCAPASFFWQSRNFTSLDRTWSCCFPKHWISHNNSSPPRCSFPFAICVPAPFCWHSRNFTLLRWFGRSATFVFFSGSFLPYSATFILYSASGWSRICRNMKRAKFVLLHVIVCQ